MRYHSTRSATEFVSGPEAILQGLSPDGGLYVPENLPKLDISRLLTRSPMDMASDILAAFLPELPDMSGLVRSAYTGKFADSTLTPTVRVGDFTVAELFRGPTSAFKDVALCMLPRLLVASKAALGRSENTLILTATSGDTGKAALEGFRDVPGIKICVFYPDGGVSPIQRSQMVTQQGDNVAVFGIRGNFDDAQTGVKNIFAQCSNGFLPGGISRLSSANSINIGRLLPQITYYFKTYADLLACGTIQMGETVNFSVPTGNFGDIFAGFLAKELGLPLGRLVCASNANQVLTDFLRTGVYDRRRPLHKTLSPSMDILVSSNLERLLWYVSDEKQVRRLMRSLNSDGRYEIPREIFWRISEHFYGCFADDETAVETIRRVWRDHGYLLDPHTATGWAAAENYRRITSDTRPMAVLSTASPFKFPAAVLKALDAAPTGDDFEDLQKISAISGLPVPENLANLEHLPAIHTKVIEKDEMLDVIRGM